MNHAQLVVRQAILILIVVFVSLLVKMGCSPAHAAEPYVAFENGMLKTVKSSIPVYKLPMDQLEPFMPQDVTIAGVQYKCVQFMWLSGSSAYFRWICPSSKDLKMTSNQMLIKCTWSQLPFKFQRIFRTYGI